MVRQRLASVHQEHHKDATSLGLVSKEYAERGVDPFISEIFYLAMVQVVLLFGAEIWVLSAAMSKHLRAYMWISYGR